MRILYLTIIFFTGFFTAYGSSLNVTVNDKNGDLISGASIRLIKEDILIKSLVTSRKSFVEIADIQKGTYTLEVEAPGFDPFKKEISIKQGENYVVVTLEVSPIEVTTEVEETNQQRALNSSSIFLTPADIENLPETGEEIEKLLKKRYGPDAVISVDGIRKEIPDKSRIASIRVVLSTYDAQNHKLGAVYIEITTKLIKQSFGGKIGFVFNNQAMNARNPFSSERLPSQLLRYDLGFNGSLIPEKSMWDVIFINDRSSKGNTIIAKPPFTFSDPGIETISRKYLVQGAYKHAMFTNHRLLVNYTFNDDRAQNLGVGGFNLPELAYSNKNRKHDFVVSESGYFVEKVFNQFKFSYKRENSETSPNNSNYRVVVLDAFSGGGAGNQSKTDSEHLELSDNLLFGIGNHALKLGGLFQYSTISKESMINANGTFTFSDLEAFQNSRPALFTLSPLARTTKINDIQTGFYIQDDLLLGSSFQLSMGLRYEAQNMLNDRNNFSPRLGFSFSPFKSGIVSFRGGAGIFYNWIAPETIFHVANNGIDKPEEIVITNPSFVNPQTVTTGTALPKSYRKFESGLTNPYVIHTSFSANTKLFKTLNFTAKYTYKKEVHKLRTRNINAPFNGVRPDLDFGNINQIESSGFFVRNSFNVILEGSPRKKIYFYFSYRLSKSISDADSPFQIPSDNYNLRKDRGASDLDIRHGFYADLILRLIGNLRLVIRPLLESPFPYNHTTGFDDNGDTVLNDRPPGVERNSLRGRWRTDIDVGISYTKSFGELKNRRYGIQPGGQDRLDVASGSQRTKRTKRYSVRFWIVANNALNQSEYSRYSGVQTSPYFTQPIDAYPPRTINFGMHFRF